MSFLNIAHRGASVDAPENTLEAFELAMSQGADMIETDLHLTADGVIALYHDDDLDGASIAEMTLAELRAKRPSMPTLDELLDLCGGKIELNLEFKRSGAGEKGLEKQTVEAIQARGLMGETLFSSFSDSSLARVRQLDESARVGLLISPRAPFEIIERADRLEAEAVHPHLRLVTDELVDELHLASYRIHVYTVDDAKEQQRLLDAGIDGIFTNVPAQLRALLDADPAS